MKTRGWSHRHQPSAVSALAPPKWILSSRSRYWHRSHPINGQHHVQLTAMHPYMPASRPNLFSQPVHSHPFILARVLVAQLGSSPALSGCVRGWLSSCHHASQDRTPTRCCNRPAPGNRGHASHPGIPYASLRARHSHSHSSGCCGALICNPRHPDQRTALLTARHPQRPAAGSTPP